MKNVLSLFSCEVRAVKGVGTLLKIFNEGCISQLIFKGPIVLVFWNSESTCSFIALAKEERERLGMVLAL